jgi:hypothetical protein
MFFMSKARRNFCWLGKRASAELSVMGEAENECDAELSVMGEAENECDAERLWDRYRA